MLHRLIYLVEALYLFIIDSFAFSVASYRQIAIDSPPG